MAKIKKSFNADLNQPSVNWLTFCLWPGWRGLPVWEGGSEPVGRACPVGPAAPQKPHLPHPDLRADPAATDLRTRPRRPNLHAVAPGTSQVPQLPAGAGLPPWPAPVLLRRGARPAYAEAPEGRSGSGRAGEAEVEEVLIAPFLILRYISLKSY